MLKEVGKTVLVGCLLNCSNISRQIELGPLGWLVIMTDVIGQTVVESTFPHGRVVRKLLSVSDIANSQQHNQ